MHFYFAACLFFSFFINTQELTPAIQDLYDKTKYPTDAQTELQFLQAKQILIKNPQDSDALSMLTMLTGKDVPYIPAVRMQVSRALADKRYKEALNLADIGIQYGDLPCLFSKATFLLNPDLFFGSSEYDPLQVELQGQQYLLQAAQEVTLPGLKKTVKYVLPHVKEYLEEIQAQGAHRLRNAMEASLQQKSKEALSNIEKEAQKQNSFTTACYFIKKYAQGDVRVDCANAPAHMIDWVARIINSNDFKYEEFKDSGAYEALEKLAVSTEHPEHISASAHLGWIDYRASTEGKLVDLEKLERNLEVASRHDVRALLLLASYSPDPKQVIGYTDRIINRLDETDPHLYETLIPDLINVHYGLMQQGEDIFSDTLARVIKHKAFKVFLVELSQDTERAGQLGVRLLQMRDHGIEHARSKKSKKSSADYRAILEAGIALTTAAADSLNDYAAWGLVEHSLRTDKNKLDDYVARALLVTKARIETGMPILIDSHDLQQLVKKLEGAKLSSENYQVLAQWYLNGLPDLIEPNEYKAVEFLSKTKDPVPMLMSLAKEFKINDPVACIEAGILMHKNKADLMECNRFFGKAIIHGSVEQRKAVADYCLQHKELVPMACNALEQLCQSLAEQEEKINPDKLWEQFVVPVINELMKWAIGTHNSQDPEEQILADRHPEAIMFFRQLHILDLFSPENRAKVEELAEWAALSGHPAAIELLEDNFKTCKKEPSAIIKAVYYWLAWIKHFQNKPERAQEVKEVSNRFKELSEWSLEPGQKDTLLFLQNAHTHYRLANFFMENDPVRAINHILLAEELFKDRMYKVPHEAAIIANEGTYQLLKEKTAQGVDWACYAFACVELNRLWFFAQNNQEDYGACFAQIDYIKSLLEKAKTFDVKQLDARLRKENYSQKGRTILTLGQIEYEAYRMIKTLLEIKKDRNAELRVRATKELMAAVQNKHPEAMYCWALSALNGQFETGQKTLDTAVNSLCSLVSIGIETAKEPLLEIYKQGILYQSRCGGTNNDHLQTKIAEVLRAAGHKLSEKMPKESADGKSAPGELDQIVVSLNNKENLPAVYEMVQKLSDAGDAAARALLGIMYRDGLAVEASATRAQELFLSALQIVDRKKATATSIKILGVAYESLRELACEDHKIAALRLKYLLDVADSNVLHVLEGIEAFENRLNKSVHKDQRELFFSSGLMHSLIRISSETQSLSISMRIARLCAARLLQVAPIELIRNENLKSLTLPFMYLSKLLEVAVLGYENIAHSFEELKEGEVKATTDLLQKMLEQGYSEPFEQICGTLVVCDGISRRSKKLAHQGIKIWEEAEKKGDMKAAFLLGLLKLRGEHIGGRIKIVGGRNEEVVPLFTNNTSDGLTKLKALAKRGNVNAYALLGQWYLEKGETKKALPYYKYMRANAPQQSNGAVGFLEAISREYEKSTEQERALIKEALRVTQENKNYLIRGAICAAYLRIIKGYEEISDEQALDLILGTTAKGAEVRTAAEFIKETQFAQGFHQWLSTYQQKHPEVCNNFMAKGYFAYALLLQALTDITKDYSLLYQQVIANCDEVLKRDPTLIEAEALKATLYFVEGIKGNEQATMAMKSSVMKCCSYMIKNKIYLATTPVLQNLLSLIMMNGAITGSNHNGTVVINEADIQKMHGDIKWAKAITEKLTLKDGQS